MDEAISTETFENWMVSVSLKARLEIKIDMVNPIPAKMPAPVKSFNLIPEGRLPHFSRINKKQNSKIPIGFPITSPNIIPRLLFVVNSLIHPSERIKPVLASAKIGRITKATGL